MRSPLKQKPLKNPGESLDDEIQRLIDNTAERYALSAAFLSALAILEWLLWYQETPRNPLLYSAFALVAIVVTAIRVVFVRKKLHNLRQGRDGEKAVAQFLDRLRETGAIVFHDIPGQGFNLDHVVMDRSGIYVIETKTMSKPDKGETRLVFDGESISSFGRPLDRNPVTQVRAARQWLAELIQESTGRKFPVRPVVVFPGWYIEPTAEARASDVWVLNPKALPSFISHSAEQMSAEDVKLCAFHLGQYVRTSK